MTYGDLTGDGVEEAAVLVRETFGAQSPTLHLVYVFGLDPAGRPVVVGTRTVSAVTPTVTIDGGRLVETVSLPASSDGAANPARVTRLALTAGRPVA